MLLEFTATCDLANPAIRAAYEDKMIADYPLAKFYADRYSKDIITLRSDLSVLERALQALVLSQYRLKVFQDYRLSIKPVVLFKAAKIAESKAFFTAFLEMVRNPHRRTASGTGRCGQQCGHAPGPLGILRITASPWRRWPRNCGTTLPRSLHFSQRRSGRHTKADPAQLPGGRGKSLPRGV